MDQLTLVIGNKNLSSWSLRPWLALAVAGLPFKEQKILLDRPESRAELQRLSPSGLVPCLKHGDRVIWDSLAILEYLNETFPEKGLWPDAPGARAHARSISAEMHSGFSALRTVWPMAFVRENLNHLTTGGVRRDLDRIGVILAEARERFGAPTGEPFLYGRFSNADAMFAPVASRIRTYGPVVMPAPVVEWIDMMMEHPAMVRWGQDAKTEVEAS